MGGEYEHLGDLHVLGGVGGIDGHVGDVVTGEGLDALVDIGGALGVTMEARVAEVGLNKAGLEVGDTDGGIGHIEAQAVGDGLHGSLGGAIYVAVGIGGVASDGADIDDMAAVALHHAGHHETRHGEQSLDVGIDHGVPVVVGAFILGLKTKGEAGIVDEHIDVFPLGGEVLDALGGFLAITHVENQRKHFCTFSGKFFTYFLESLGVAAGEDEAVAVGGELAGAAETDATRSASYQYSLVHLFYCFVYYG